MKRILFILFIAVIGTVTLHAQGQKENTLPAKDYLLQTSGAVGICPCTKMLVG